MSDLTILKIKMANSIFDEELWTMQKYRSHRKHLLSREAEAATWSQKRQIYGGGGKNMSPWLVPTMGFPPPMKPLPQHFRPLHVWGHPSVDQPLMQVWPKHLAPPPPAAAWGPTPHPPLARPPPDPSFWHSHHQRVIFNKLSAMIKNFW